MKNERIQELGLSSVEVSKQIMNAIEGMKATSIDIGELNNVDIRVEYMDQYNQSIEDLMDTYINTPMGVKVPLRDIAVINISKRANVVTKEDLEYTIDILAYTHDRAFSKIVKDINKLMENFPLPEEYEIDLTGDQESLSESMGDMIFLLALSIIFVYLLLVPQFKSFIHPITIMAAIPLVFIGVTPALILTGVTVTE